MANLNKETLIFDGAKFQWTEGNETFKVSVEYDDGDISPRDDDNFGIISAKYRDYRLADKGHEDPYLTARELLCDFISEDDLDDMTFNDMVLKIQENHRDTICLLPLFVYDHGSITISTGYLSGYDRWDTSYVGFIYTTKERFEKLHGKSENWYQDAKEILKSEVNLFDRYLRNDYYMVMIEKLIVVEEKCPHCGEVIKTYEVWEEVDSCGGFYIDNLEDIEDQFGIEFNYETLEEI